MNKLISYILLVAGSTLIVYGILTTTSFGNGLSRFFTGVATDKTIMIFLGGFAAAFLGAYGIFRGAKSS